MNRLHRRLCTSDRWRMSVPGLTALEIDAKLAAALSSRLAKSNVRVIEGDATHMPFGSSEFSSGFRSRCCITFFLQSCKTRFCVKCAGFGSRAASSWGATAFRTGG